MIFFEEATLRLKQQLKVTEDRQAAEFLGMTGKAWTARKRRESFPEKELYALAAKRPELNLDVDYVLTGITREAHARLAAQRQDLAKAADSGLSTEELFAYARAKRPGPSPERKALLAQMLGDLRVDEFESVFSLVQSIVGLRMALGEASDDKAGE